MPLKRKKPSILWQLKSGYNSKSILILDETMCILFGINTLGESINPTILLTAIGK